jgi:hypothetical protein
MSADFLKRVDWQAPWLQALKPVAQPILEAADWRQALNDAASDRQLRNYRGLPVRFVPQMALPKEVAYEAFIGQSGAVPTRDNLHDFFNALVWLTFPCIKAELNALQSTAIERALSKNDSLPEKRGALRDAVTLFDENAALVVTDDASVEVELREHRWQEVLWDRRERFENGTCRTFLFGHALMEKLTMPYKAITAHAWIVKAEEFSLSSIDALVAQSITYGLSTRDFTPLPVLGVPGWWPDQDEDFYKDTAVFRPKRVQNR